MIGRRMQPIHYLAHACNFDLQGGDTSFLRLVGEIRTHPAKRAGRHHHDVTFLEGLAGM
jgi:hypothetical protein